MKYFIPNSAIVLVLLYGIYNAYHTKSAHKKKLHSASENYIQHTTVHKVPHIEEELKHIHTVLYIRDYIVSVINHGSSQLHFKPQEVMEGGFASPQDAPKIACYVISLGGESCIDLSSENAAMFYSSNCGGCHGEDGRGLGGTYPDLTRRPLLGIEKREAFLKHLLHSN